MAIKGSGSQGEMVYQRSDTARSACTTTLSQHRSAAAGLVFFIFDLLHLDGDDVGARPLIERKARLAALPSGVAPPLHYSDQHRGAPLALRAAVEVTSVHLVAYDPIAQESK